MKFFDALYTVLEGDNRVKVCPHSHGVNYPSCLKCDGVLESCLVWQQLFMQEVKP